jgi:hypothetical protein
VARASDLELSLRIALADFHQLGISSACLLKEVTDVCNLLRHVISVYWSLVVKEGNNNCERPGADAICTIHPRSSSETRHNKSAAPHEHNIPPTGFFEVNILVYAAGPIVTYIRFKNQEGNNTHSKRPARELNDGGAAGLPTIMKVSGRR